MKIILVQWEKHSWNLNNSNAYFHFCILGYFFIFLFFQNSNDISQEF
jgi:hypothetical protein